VTGFPQDDGHDLMIIVAQDIADAGDFFPGNIRETGL
jgi:hypothetical protein